jgi:putative oxidoreductase
VFSGNGGGWEFPVFWIAMLVVQALLGDGAFAWRPSFGLSPKRVEHAS